MVGTKCSKPNLCSIMCHHVVNEFELSFELCKKENSPKYLTASAYGVWTDGHLSGSCRRLETQTVELSACNVLPQLIGLIPAWLVSGLSQYHRGETVSCLHHGPDTWVTLGSGGATLWLTNRESATCHQALSSRWWRDCGGIENKCSNEAWTRNTVVHYSVHCNYV